MVTPDRPQAVIQPYYASKTFLGSVNHFKLIALTCAIVLHIYSGDRKNQLFGIVNKGNAKTSIFFPEVEKKQKLYRRQITNKTFLRCTFCHKASLTQVP